MRERTEDIHKELQDLDLIGSSHLEDILIGEKIHLDLPFPSKRYKNHGRNGGRASSSRSTMEEREWKNQLAFGGRRGLL
jgi:hypothetical protein